MEQHDVGTHAIESIESIDAVDAVDAVDTVDAVDQSTTSIVSSKQPTQPKKRAPSPAVNAESESKRTKEEDEAATTEAAPDPRGRNATYLATRHPMPADIHAVFEEEAHKYTVHGQVVKRSCTGAKDALFPKMDSKLTIRTYYASWKRNPSHKLHALIWETLDAHQSHTDEDAMDKIEASWTQLGVEASELGTLLHLYIELHYNECPMKEPPTTIAHEVKLFDQFVASPFYTRLRLRMVRTELTVYEYREGVAVCAGQIDGLMADAEGRHYIFDWKRSKHVLKPYERAFKNETGTHPLTAHIPNTHFHKYSLQLSLYAEMMARCNGIDVEDRLYLVRMHPNLDDFELTKCENYRGVARSILDMMYEQLAQERA